MNITMDLSEIFLYLELMKKEKKKTSLDELNLMVYFLEDYDQIKEFKNKLEELKLKVPKKFYTEVLIHFIEDYEDCVTLKNMILPNRDKRRTRKEDIGIIFRHQIMLCKSKEEATNIQNEAKEYGVEVSERWVNRFDSLDSIKIEQIEWKKTRRSDKDNRFTEIYEQFCKMKIQYFESISLKQLKQTLLEQQATGKNTRKIAQISVFNRSVYIKEFAKRVANGVCQLCDKEAPFLDKQGNPFLEVHHIHYLSKGGSDTIDNVVALCPNCHRKIHQLELEEDIKKLSKKHWII
ncbi:restriction endonuclease [Peribacillus asahii]|uniref:Restriction endonuclease n=1 Tax=Peribacillus asahii TaxID=228899 RepID=A0A3Q9RLF9_9BACI|nr:HNH endonuclease [Peribacillus asahii]AZV42011.1 restriction endonuclease [Peribacillus asahii]